MQTALIKCAVASLYQEPECGAAVDEVIYGMKVEVLSEQCGWCQVQTHYRYKGYIQRRELLFDQSRIAAWEQAERRVIIKNHADILTAPSFQAKRLESLPKGAQIMRMEAADEDGFTKVGLVDGRTGFLRNGWLGPFKKSMYEDEYEKLRGMAARLSPEPFLTPFGYIKRFLEREEEEFRGSIAQTALSYLGTPYRWGGKTTYGIDCSGLCQMAYLLNGLVIYRDASIQKGFPVREIPKEQAKCGDLIYAPGHVVLYLGNGKYVHSTGKSGSDGVVINSFHSSDPEYREDLALLLNTAGSVF